MRVWPSHGFAFNDIWRRTPGTLKVSTNFRESYVRSSLFYSDFICFFLGRGILLLLTAKIYEMIARKYLKEDARMNSARLFSAAIHRSDQTFKKR